MPVVEQDAGLEIIAALAGQAAEPFGIGGVEGGGGFNFYALHFSALSYNEIDFHFIFIAVVPEFQIRICPAGLGNNLLDNERLKQMPHLVTFGVPVGGSESGKGRGEAAVGQVNRRQTTGCAAKCSI